MDTVLVDIANKGACRFLQGLEELNVIKLIDKEEIEKAQRQNSEAL